MLQFTQYYLLNTAKCKVYNNILIRNNFLETDTCPFDQEFVYLCTKKFVRAVYQEILVFIISKIV